MRWPRRRLARPPYVQQLQFLHVHELQRQPPLVQVQVQVQVEVQVQAAAFFSLIFSMMVRSFHRGPLIRSR